MSSKTKIVVLRMKEVIYTGVFIALGVLLVLLLLFMFLPRNKQSTNTNDTGATSAAKYTAGVYNTQMVLNNNTIDVEVVVDDHLINSIRLVNLSESVTTMYPLIEPALTDLADQIYEQQSTDNITYSEDSKYTSMLLLNAIDAALEKAVIVVDE